MNNKIFTLFIAALLISNVSFAKIFRLGYTGPQITGVDYTNAQTAHDAASAGDTLLLFPGSYNINTATKKLVYLGFGYYTSSTDANPNLQLLTGNCRLAIYLNVGASGSTFEGIEGLSAYPISGQSINDITIRRSKGTAAVFSSAGTTCNNWQISQCTEMYISRNVLGGNTINLRVENSHISQVYLDGSNLHTGRFNNCVFTNAPDLNNNAINFQNCIFFNSVGATNGITNSLFQYCLFPGADPGLSGSNNKFNIAFSTSGINNVFTGYPQTVAGQTADGKYQLKVGSPAIGAGMGGIDMGMYGGANPYKLSGIPSIPAFYKLTAPSNNATINPYTITFSVRSNN